MLQDSKLQKVKDAWNKRRSSKTHKTIRVFDFEKLENICQTSCEKFPLANGKNLTVDDIKSGCRKPEYITIRFATMWIGYYVLDITFKQIAIRFKRNHATVMHACEDLEEWYSTNPTFRKKFDELLFACE
jgi:chromosomal replication initiation ATPase DnaA